MENSTGDKLAFDYKDWLSFKKQVCIDFMACGHSFYEFVACTLFPPSPLIDLFGFDSTYMVI